MSVIDLNELVKLLEKKFGVSAAAVAVAAPAGGAPVEAGEFRCGDDTNDNLRMVRWMYLATVTGLPVNSAYLSRVPTDSVRRECDTLLAMQNAPVIAPGEVVIVRSGALLPRYRSQAGNTCGEVDGLQVCVAAGRDTDLAVLLQRQ